MTKLSTGEDATLANYRKLTVAFCGEDSAAVKFLDDKIAMDGANEEVLADERQMVNLIMSIHLNGKPKPAADGRGGKKVK